MDLVGTYKQIEFPKSRYLVIDVVELGRLKHHVPCFIELDVTNAREYLRKIKAKSGEGLSFTGWIAKCIGQAVSEHKQMHALRRGGDAMVLFNDVDILIMIEKSLDGEMMSRPYVLRKANEKSVQQIHREIRAAQALEADTGDMVLGENPWYARFYPLIPKYLRLAMGRHIMADPFSMKRNVGTVEITAIGMMGNFGGWAVPVSPQPLLFALGGIAKKAGVVNDRIEIREYLSLSFAFDHDVVDGAPVVRFIARLSELVGDGFGLSEILLALT
ncbi:MAG: 2-oxo acid dehydrogenase subunit E2 [Candidatus Bathyarchaeota archaeon]|nr:2-oxo acid dehydrogenase subunit E2 [Candidatus Bathyarchaeota archaeon]